MPSSTRRAAVHRAMSDEDKNARSHAILAAAKRVFARRGFYDTTVADIAKAAHLSYGSVYFYFESKDALFHALMESEEHALRAHIAKAISESQADAGAPDAVLRRAVRATLEFFEADRAAVKLLFRDSFALGNRFEMHLFGIYERFIDDLEALVVDAQRRGTLVAAPPRMVAFSAAALIGQLAHRRLTTDDGLEAAAVADFAVSLLFEGLRPR